MNINWKVRVKNKAFWLALIPAVLLVVQAIATPLGYVADFEAVGENATLLVNAVFGLLTVLGVVTDFTTEGFCDSAQAQQYEEPKPKEA